MPITGVFELFIDEETLFRFRLKAPDGTVVAVSRPYPDKSSAVSGISDVREYAGMGLITHQCPDSPVPWNEEQRREARASIIDQSLHGIQRHTLEEIRDEMAARWRYVGRADMSTILSGCVSHQQYTSV